MATWLLSFTAGKADEVGVAVETPSGPVVESRQAADAPADAPADMVTRADIRADLAELEARLTWRFAGAMLAQTGVILGAVIGAAIAMRRPTGRLVALAADVLVESGCQSVVVASASHGPV